MRKIMTALLVAVVLGSCRPLPPPDLAARRQTAVVAATQGIPDASVDALADRLRRDGTAPPASEREIALVRDHLDVTATPLRTPSGPALVHEVQSHLATLGLLERSQVDGRAGPATEQALRRFQGALRVPETGTVDAQAVDLLRRALATVVPVQTVPLGDPVMRGALALRAVGAVDATQLLKPFGAVPGLDELAMPETAGYWTWFFAGSVIHLSQSGGSRIAGFYNPVADAWVVTRWQGGDTPVLRDAVVVPGDTLLERTEVRALPAWLAAPIDTAEDAIIAGNTVAVRAFRAMAARGALDRMAWSDDAADEVLLRLLDLAGSAAPIATTAPGGALLASLRRAAVDGSATSLRATAEARDDVLGLAALPEKLVEGLTPYAGFAEGERAVVVLLDPRSARWMVFAYLDLSGGGRLHAARFVDVEAALMLVAERGDRR